MKSVRRHVSEPTDIDNVSLIHNHVVRVEVQSDQLVIELANPKGAGVAKCRLVFAAWTPRELRSETMNPGCHPSLFFLAMFHTNSIITVAGLPRMSLQAGLSNVAAYFAIARLLGLCRVGAVYEKHQQDGKGSHHDLLSLYVATAGTTALGFGAHRPFQAMCGCGNHSGLNRTGARSLWSNIGAI